MIAEMMQDRATQEEQQRQVLLAARWRAYHGDVGRSLLVKPGQRDDNISAPLCRLAVDKGVNFLFGQAVEWTLADDADASNTDQATDWLTQCLQKNRYMTRLQEIGINGGVTGQGFVKIQLPKTPLDFPRLIALDPQTVRVQWEPDDYLTVVRYVITTSGTDPYTGDMVTLRQVIEQDGNGWQIRDQESRGNSTVWMTINETRWQWEWAPIFHCQNLPCPNEWWGLSDLENDVIATNKTINYVMSNIGRILRFHAHPKTWAAGVTAQQLSIGPDEMLLLNKDATLQNLEMVSDLASSLEFYKRLMEMYHATTHIPEIATGKTEGNGQLSGVALQVLYGPLIERTQTKQRLYGDMWEDVLGALLEMGGYGTLAEWQGNITLKWPNLLPQDAQSENQALLLEQQLGVSNKTLLTKMGYDADMEQEQKQAETQATGENLMAAFDRGGRTMPPGDAE